MLSEWRLIAAGFVLALMVAALLQRDLFAVVYGLVVALLLFGENRRRARQHA